MRANANVADGETPLAALMRETAAATVNAVFSKLRRGPIVHPEWLSLQDAAAYTGYSEQQFSDFAKRGVAPKSVLVGASHLRIPSRVEGNWRGRG